MEILNDNESHEVVYFEAVFKYIVKLRKKLVIKIHVSFIFLVELFNVYWI